MNLEVGLGFSDSVDPFRQRSHRRTSVGFSLYWRYENSKSNICNLTLIRICKIKLYLPMQEF